MSNILKAGFPINVVANDDFKKSTMNTGIMTVCPRWEHGVVDIIFNGSCKGVRVSDLPVYVSSRGYVSGKCFPNSTKIVKKTFFDLIEIHHDNVVDGIIYSEYYQCNYDCFSFTVKNPSQ